MVCHKAQLGPHSVKNTTVKGQHFHHIKLQLGYIVMSVIFCCAGHNVVSSLFVKSTTSSHIRDMSADVRQTVYSFIYANVAITHVISGSLSPRHGASSGCG